MRTCDTTQLPDWCCCFHHSQHVFKRQLWESVALTMTATGPTTCSKGEWCVTRNWLQPLTPDNFRKGSWWPWCDDFFSVCNYCHKQSSCTADPLLSRPWKTCSRCNTLKKVVLGIGNRETCGIMYVGCSWVKSCTGLAFNYSFRWERMQKINDSATLWKVREEMTRLIALS